MEKTPVLSICIPTYNRSKYLKKCLESIICQEEFKNGMVEIVISDNASEDDTQEVVSEYLERYANIIYNRNSANVRDQNFPIVLSKANGTLRRLCNDTLVFQQNALNYMCEIVEKHKKERPFICWANGKAKRTIKEIVKFQEFIRTISFRITSIACFSIWENDIDELLEDMTGTELFLWQVKKSLSIVHDKGKVLIDNKKLAISQRIEKKDISYGIYKVFYVNYFKLLQPYLDEHVLTQEDKEWLEKDLLYNFFLGWCLEWELLNGKFQYASEENLKQAIEEQYREKEYWKDYEKKYEKKYEKEKRKRKLKKIIKKLIKYKS